MAHITLELHIRHAAGALTTDAMLRHPGSQAESVLARDVPLALDDQALLFHALDPDAYGRILTDQLFADQRLRDAWTKARAIATTGDLQLRLNLDAADTALHDLCWETLCDPETGQMIALHERVRLVRTLDSADLTPVLIPPRPTLRVLVIVSNPSDLERFRLVEVDVEGEVGRARAALGDIPTTILGDYPEAAGRATLANLTSQLREAPPIVLLIAHGTITVSGPLLWLEQDDGTSHQVSGADFVTAVERLSARPLLVALLSCQSSGRGYDDTLRALGPQLARIGVPAVLGFQGNVAMSTVKAMLPTLITELRRDGRIDRALAAARAALGARQPWWQASLWLRTDGQIWTEPQKTPLESALEHLNALPLDRIPPIAPLPTLHRIPLARNPLFVGREDDLRALAAVLKDEGATAIIGQTAATTGIGGIGKTNVATEFVHRYGQFFAGGVFWLSFTDPAAIPAEVAACGHALDLPGFTDLKLDEQVQRVRAAWQWPLPRLLIFDNCDDATPNEAEALIQQWRPTSGGCRVLITSRRASWSKSLGITAVPLGVLRRGESIALLRKHRPDLSTDDLVLDAIAEELGDLPLALHLAGSFLETYRASPTLGDPAGLLAELRDTQLLDHDALQGIDVTPSPTNHDLHVARTFALSYERLDANDLVDALAIKLLARAACLAPGEPIPRTLLLATLEIAEDDRAAQRQVEQGLQRLVALGLLDSEAEGALRMHRLLAVFVERMGVGNDVQAAVEQTLQQLLGSRQDAADHIERLDDVLIHLRWVANRALNREDAAAALLSNNVAFCLEQCGEFQTARILYTHALQIHERILKPYDPLIAISLNNLAALLKTMGDYPASFPLHQRALQVRESILEPNHPDIAASLNNFAELLCAMGKYTAAWPLYERALRITEEVHGPSHPKTALSLNNLAIVLKAMGEYRAARSLYERAIDVSEQALGKSHPQTAACLNNFANLLRDTGEYEMAESLYAQVIGINEQMLGSMHPDTATALDNLGHLYRTIANTDAALPLYERAYTIRKTALGDAHPHTVSSLNHIGLIHFAKGEMDTARSLYEDALAMSEYSLGAIHPATAATLYNLARLYEEMHDYELAQQFHRRALAIRAEALGPMHPDTAQSLQSLADTLAAMGQYAAAQPLYERALHIHEQAFGPSHPDTVTNLNNLAVNCAHQGKIEEAAHLFRRVVPLNEQRLGPDHPETLRSRQDLTDIEVHLAQQRTPTSAEEQIAMIMQQVEEAMRVVLASGTAKHRADLIERIEAQANWAGEGESGGSPYLALAVHLRALANQLRRTAGREAL